MFVRLLDWLIALSALAGLALVGWWSVYQSPHNAVKLQSDLQSAVQQKLNQDGHGWAKVTMHGQRAVLSGAAPADAAFEAARESALTTVGHGGLIFGGVTVVENASEAAPPISPYTWNAVKTADARIILGGHVPSDAIRQTMLDDAESLAPGQVEDRMKFASGAPTGNWQGVARLGLRQLGNLDAGQAELIDSRLAVRGVAMSDAAKARVIADVANIVAPFQSITDIRGSSLWSARHERGTLILSGRVANQADHDEIIGIASQYFAGDVINEMTIEDLDYQDWVDGVRLGLPHFTNFETGEMAFEPEGEGFTFQGEASGSTLAYLAEDMKKLEGPYGVTIEVETVQVAVAEIANIDFEASAVDACQAAFDAVLASNKVYFRSGKDKITRRSGETLDKLMAVSNRCDGSLVFELGGHTDSVGNRAQNLVLSQDRAKAVAAYMTSAGMDSARLSAVGYGPDQPAASNDTSEGRAQNRRIEFTVKERSE